MSRYCISCGAANANAANVCSRCGKVLAGGITISSGTSGGGYKRNGILPLKYQIGSIAMFVGAGISVLIMIIMLANKEEYMFKLIMRSREIPNFSSLEQMEGTYMVGVILICLICAGIYLHCGFLLRKTQLRGKGILIFYSILFGLNALLTLVGFTNANNIKATDIFSLVCAIGACVLLIMKCYDWEMERRNTYN